MGWPGPTVNDEIKFASVRTRLNRTVIPQAHTGLYRTEMRVAWSGRSWSTTGCSVEGSTAAVAAAAGQNAFN